MFRDNNISVFTTLLQSTLLSDTNRSFRNAVPSRAILFHFHVILWEIGSKNSLKPPLCLATSHPGICYCSSFQCIPLISIRFVNILSLLQFHFPFDFKLTFPGALGDGNIFEKLTSRFLTCWTFLKLVMKFLPLLKLTCSWTCNKEITKLFQRNY